MHYVSSRSDFDFELAVMFVIEKRISDSPSSGSRRLADSQTRRVRELATPQLGESGVSDSPTRRVFFLSLKSRVGESFFDYEYLGEFKDKIRTARNNCGKTKTAQRRLFLLI